VTKELILERGLKREQIERGEIEEKERRDRDER
jgi:hypothetical protein